MKVLVTGGAGFIGSHLVDLLLAKGHSPVVLDDLSSGSKSNVPAGVTLHQVDISHASDVRRILDLERPDAVAHQAAQMSVSRSVREPVFDAQINVLGLLNVFSSAVAVGVKKIVFASSGGVLYGDVATPAAENAPAGPVSPYGISKWVGEQYLQFFVREHGIQGTALRYANVYGPRQNPHGEAGVVAIFCEKWLGGHVPTVNGDGKYIRDYVYVQDVARANLLALESNSPGTFKPYNVGTAVCHDTNQLAANLKKSLEQQLGRSLPDVNHGPARAGDLRSSVISFNTIQTELGWKPEMAVEAGLAETARWFAAKAS